MPFKILTNSWWTILRPYLIISAFSPSQPGFLLFFRDVAAFLFLHWKVWLFLLVWCLGSLLVSLCEIYFWRNLEMMLICSFSFTVSPFFQCTITFFFGYVIMISLIAFDVRWNDLCYFLFLLQVSLSFNFLHLLVFHGFLSTFCFSPLIVHVFLSYFYWLLYHLVTCFVVIVFSPSIFLVLSFFLVLFLLLLCMWTQCYSISLVGDFCYCFPLLYIFLCV